jgi:NAD(P)H-dependent FMN reductase
MADCTRNVISICGSLRQGSYNRMVMKALAGLAPAGMQITEAPAYQTFPERVQAYAADADARCNGMRAVGLTSDVG